MRSLGDRRARTRFEIVGALRGTLEVDEPAAVVNVSHSGALIESPWPVAVGSVQMVRFVIGERATTLEARVRHVRRIHEVGTPRYLVGLQFVSAPAAFIQSLEHLQSTAGDS